MANEPNHPYYRLPRWSVGAKLTAYCSDYAGGNHLSAPRRAERTTPDGQSWLRCIQTSTCDGL